MTRLTIHVAQMPGHHERVTEFMDHIATLGISGASVFPGTCGFGRGHHLHEPHHGHRADETPMEIIIVDEPATIDDVVHAMKILLPQAVAVLDKVTAIRYG
jgi:PII-like signaling protein